MALFHECMLKCAQKLLDTADIVREALFLSWRAEQGLSTFLIGRYSIGSEEWFGCSILHSFDN
jgi:hypothetical protein